METSKTVSCVRETKCHLTFLTHPPRPMNMTFDRTVLTCLSHFYMLWQMQGSITSALHTWHNCPLAPSGQRNISGAKRIPGEPNTRLLEASEPKGDPQTKILEGHQSRLKGQAVPLVQNPGVADNQVKDICKKPHIIPLSLEGSLVKVC